MTNALFSTSLEQTVEYGPVIVLKYKPASEKEKTISVSIAPERGSNMFKFTYGEHDIIYTEPELLRDCGFTGNFVLFPTPNRVKDATYSWMGKTITQKKNGELRLLHGLVYDEKWQYEEPTRVDDGISLTTYITISKDSPLYDSYPFLCTLKLSYILRSSGVSVTYTVINNGEEEMPFGFALHPYFSRLSDNDNTYISVPAKSWMESPADTLIPTGNLIDVLDKPYNINTPRPIGELSLDHVYTELKPGYFATIDYRSLGFQVELQTSEDFTHTVVYTGHPNAVCIENQTCSTDAINLWNGGYTRESHITILRESASCTGSITFAIS